MPHQQIVRHAKSHNFMLHVAFLRFSTNIDNGCLCDRARVSAHHHSFTCLYDVLFIKSNPIALCLPMKIAHTQTLAVQLGGEGSVYNCMHTVTFGK